MNDENESFDQSSEKQSKSSSDEDYMANDRIGMRKNRNFRK